jgi:hypothetical protein
MAGMVILYWHCQQSIVLQQFMQLPALSDRC